MDDPDLLLALLSVLAATPSNVDANAIAVAGTDLVLVTDDRREATTLLLEGVAGKYGQVVASACVQHELKRRDILGCLVRVEGDDVRAAAAKIRTAYALATAEDGGDEPPAELF